MVDEDLLRETHRLALENNKMLRSMRRAAFWGGLLRLIIYAAILIAPIWFYFTYLDASVQQMLETARQLQGINTSVQSEIGGFGGMWQQLQEALTQMQRGG